MSVVSPRWFDRSLPLIALILAAGCSQRESPIDEESSTPAIGRDELDPAFANTFRRAAKQQSKTIRGTTIVVHRACSNVRLTDPDAKDQQWVGVDVELQTFSDDFEGLDLREIEVHDGETGQRLAKAATVQRLSDDALPAADDDPIFAGVDKYRGMLVYAVPSETKSVTLYCDGEPLNDTPLPLGACNIVVPQSDIVVLGALRRPADDPTYDAWLVAVECRQWSRMATPGKLALRCLSNNKPWMGEADRFIEVDARQRPIASPTGPQPLYFPHRWFVVEFWCPKGSLLVDLEYNRLTRPLPTTYELELPEETLSELAKAPRLERARHRRE
jgi:hypothetical protein